MYYTGINPMTNKAVYVTTDYHEKKLQRALLQFRKPENANLVREALHLAGREDLIGDSPECLVRHAFGQGKRSQFDPRAKLKKKIAAKSSVKGDSGLRKDKKTAQNAPKAKKTTDSKSKNVKLAQKNRNKSVSNSKKQKKLR
jgi:hypothetical protein